jgi:hypothetical protein
MCVASPCVMVAQGRCWPLVLSTSVPARVADGAGGGDSAIRLWSLQPEDLTTYTSSALDIVLPLQTGAFRMFDALTLAETKDMPSCVAFSGHTAIVVSKRGCVLAYDCRQHTLATLGRGEDRKYTCIAACDDGQVIALGE